MQVRLLIFLVSFNLNNQSISQSTNAVIHKALKDPFRATNAAKADVYIENKEKIRVTATGRNKETAALKEKRRRSIK